MKYIDKNIVASLLIISLLLSGVEIYLNLREEVVSDTTTALWAIVFAVLVAVWVTKDPKRSEFDTPYEFGFFIYVFWPLMLPYYLVRTRGVEGLVVFLGFAAIYLVPFFSGLVAYVYFT